MTALAPAAGRAIPDWLNRTVRSDMLEPIRAG